MITYLYGKDTYRIKEYLAEHAPGALVGEEALKSQGLFGQAPVILYDPPATLKIPEDIEVFVVTEKPAGGRSASGGKGLEFNPLKGPEIKKWIQEILKKQGIGIASPALAILEQRYKDSFQMKLLLDLVCNYVYPHTTISLTDIEAVAPTVSEETIFKLTDAVANNHKREAMILLERQLAYGADPYYLFSMILFQFRNMLAPDRAGVHPFAAQKARTAAKRFADNALKRAYKNLYQLEIDAKTGIQDMTDGLYSFVSNL